MTEINDRSLLKCTIKKSADVLKKVVLYGLYVIAAITAIVYFGITKLWEPIVNVISVVITAIWSIITVIGSILLTIPWYIYIGGMAVLTIPVYSLLWCVARDLEKEDWESDSAKDIAALALALAFALVAFAFALALAFALVAFAFALVAFALAAFALAAFALAAFALAAFALADPKIFLVIGAYLHYRKRTRELRQAGSP